MDNEKLKINAQKINWEDLYSISDVIEITNILCDELPDVINQSEIKIMRNHKKENRNP